VNGRLDENVRVDRRLAIGQRGCRVDDSADTFDGFIKCSWSRYIPYNYKLEVRGVIFEELAKIGGFVLVPHCCTDFKTSIDYAAPC
jgi:hypothetical protein